MKSRTINLMKNFFLILGTGMLLIACGGEDKNSMETVLASNDVATLQAKKDALVTQQQEIQQQVKQLDAKLMELNP